jgi:putative aldouronate transport system substrate-binding protein
MVVEYVLDDQYQNTLQTRFAAMNEIPMFVSCYRLGETDVLALANNGIVLDINTILPESDGTASNFFTNNDFGAAAKAKVTTPEGQMYWLPNIYISVFEGRYGIGTNICVTIRQDWLEEQGLAMPTTLDEYTNALKTFNTAYGGGDAGFGVYSYDPCSLNDAIAQWFGVVRGLANIKWTEGEATSPWFQETFTDYITYVNSLYTQGLYDDEMIGDTQTLRTKSSNNQVGSYTAYALSTTYEPLIVAADPSLDASKVCYADIYPIEAVEGVKPLLALEDPVYIWDEFVFTNQLTDLALGAAWLDAYYCDEHLDCINYGVEGVNYEVVNGEKQWKQYTGADGVQYNADQLNQYLQEKADERISYGKILYSRYITPDYTYYMLDTATFNCRDVLGWAAQKCEYQTNTLDWGNWTSIDVGGTLATASAEETEKYNEVYNTVDTASKAYVAELVKNGNVGDIQAYSAQLASLGLQDIVDIYQARYDRFIG